MEFLSEDLHSAEDSKKDHKFGGSSEDSIEAIEEKSAEQFEEEDQTNESPEKQQPEMIKFRSNTVRLEGAEEGYTPIDPLTPMEGENFNDRVETPQEEEGEIDERKESNEELEQSFGRDNRDS
jgi:hypothetical protein